MRRERPRCPPAGAAPRSPRAPLPPLLLLPLLALALAPRPVAGDQQDCASLLRDFYEFNQKEAVPFNVDNMVYFLHVPRTAGRTFHTCLLKQGVPASKRCPKSYDHLRIDVGLPSCRLLSSHDDFSVVQQLPPGTAVVTQLRDPVDRFLSAYEFAIEVASRQVKKPPNQAKNRTATAGRTLTDEVWPWSHLVPFFVQDTRARLAAATAKADAEKAAGGPGHWLQLATEEGRTYYWNKARNTSKWQLDEADKPHLVPPLDPYNNPLTMPLAEFAAHPLAVDLVHNGEAFQVLGLTNYSHWPKADALRQCAISDQGVARELSAYAKRRLATFAHVGTTDALFESVEACAGALGMALDAPAYAQGEARRANIENPNRSLRYPEAIARGERAAAAAAAAHEKAAHDHGRGEEGPEFYDDGPPGPGGDAEGLHELAGAVRAAAARADGAAAAWNAAVRSGAPQAELRSLRLDLSRARAEVAAAQDALLAARGEEAEKRAREVANANKLIETGRDLGIEFHNCAQAAQSKNKQRRRGSLANLVVPADGRKVNYSHAARQAIPAEVLQEIRRRSFLDVELLETARQLLAKKRAELQEGGRLRQLPPEPPERRPPPAAAAGGGGGEHQQQPPQQQQGQQQGQQHARPKREGNEL